MEALRDDGPLLPVLVCDGLADGILLKDPEKFLTEDMSGIAVNIDVVYTTEYSDPYTQVLS